MNSDCYNIGDVEGNAIGSLQLKLNNIILLLT